MIHEFVYAQPVKIFFGAGQFAKLGKLLGGLRTRLSDLGEVDLEKFCRSCAAHPLMQNNPVPLDEMALRRMFEALA